MPFRRFRFAVAFSLLVLTTLFIAPVTAQDAPPVLILPVDGANFLPGVRFDFRVEVHAEALPDDFAVTVNGDPAADFFGSESTEESWTFGEEDAPTPSQSVIWRDLTSPAPGEYTVEVIAGGTTHTALWTVREPQASAGARNIILFVADGGNIPLFTAARLVSRGQVNGRYPGEPMAWETFEEFGLSRTSALDGIITDSAAGASAWQTGHKTAVEATGIYPDTSADPFDDPNVETLAELLRRTRGMSIGIATNSELVDATSASLYGHARDRERSTRSLMLAGMLESGLNIDVMLGGGGRYFLPASAEGSRRPDERDMFVEFEAAGYTVVTNATELDALMSGDALPTRVLGVFHQGYMDAWLDRNVYTENVEEFPDQPGLDVTTLAALELLNQNPNGFFLQVENDYIDSGEHVMDFERTIADTIEFERAIAAAVEWVQANAPDTLIVVTADHAFGFDVYGTVDVEAFNAGTTNEERRDAIEVDVAPPPSYMDVDGDLYPDNWEPDRTLAFTFGSYPDHTEDFQVSPEERTPAVGIDEDETAYVDNPDDDPNGIVRSGNLPMGASDSVHSLQDVPVFATGPGSDFFGRVIDNTEFFFGFARALGLDPSAEDGTAR
ncbi:MAG: alkaline phosphatase [bacterium]|nr:alkaline phosphatase [bacterium]